MALVGGGGAGNVAGSNPSGTSSSLNFIGDHAWITTGIIEVGSNFVTLVDFTMGTTYLVGDWVGSYFTLTTDDIQWVMFFDGQEVSSYGGSAMSGAVGGENRKPVLIPPYTRVQIKAKNDSSSTGRDVGVVLVGRTYA